MEGYIMVPAEVVAKGKNTLWLYAWLALHEGDLDDFSVRENARRFDMSVQEYRTARKNAEFFTGKYGHEIVPNTDLTQSNTNDHIGSIEIQQVTKVPNTDLTQSNTKPPSPSVSPTPPSNPTPNPLLNKEKTTTKVVVEKKSNVSPLEQKQAKFYQELIPYVIGQEPAKNSRGEPCKQYPAEMVRDFYEYWSGEMQHRKGVMLKETQKTFVLSRRLATWQQVSSHGKWSGESRGMQVGVNLQSETDKDYGDGADW